MQSCPMVISWFIKSTSMSGSILDIKISILENRDQTRGYRVGVLLNRQGVGNHCKIIRFNFCSQFPKIFNLSAIWDWLFMRFIYKNILGAAMLYLGWQYLLGSFLSGTLKLGCYDIMVISSSDFDEDAPGLLRLYGLRYKLVTTNWSSSSLVSPLAIGPAFLNNKRFSWRSECTGFGDTPEYLTVRVSHMLLCLNSFAHDSVSFLSLIRKYLLWILLILWHLKIRKNVSGRLFWKQWDKQSARQ